MDGITIAASVCDIKRLIGCKIEKVSQPESDLIILRIKGIGISSKLLISASAQNGRIQLTNTKYENPMEPPMFCMLMRKRITGGYILSVDQYSLDRTVTIGISAYNELGDSVTYRLICEMMGRHSNIILVNENGIIVDAIKRIDISASAVHPIFPGLSYEFVPLPSKLDPRDMDSDQIADVLKCLPRMDRAISDNILGHAPDTARLILRCAGADDLQSASYSDEELDRIAKSIQNLYARIRSSDFSPCLLLGEDERVIGVAPFTPQAKNTIPMATIGEAIDAFYAEKDIYEHIRRTSSAMRKSINTSIERCERKIARINMDMPSEEKLEQMQLFGELLTVYAHALESGVNNVFVDNYYTDPVSKLEIPIDADLSITKNAQLYYKRYKKGKTALNMGKKQIHEAKLEIDYLSEMMYLIENAKNNADLDVLYGELAELGYVKRPRQQKKKRSTPKTKPMRYISSDGIEILVGKSSEQNEELTFRVAHGGELWLHVKDMPGAHVIVRATYDLPERTLFEAGNIAAYNSKGKSGALIPVDYTLRKNVKKIPGGRSGMVTYTDQHTMYITPDEELVKRLSVE